MEGSRTSQQPTPGANYPGKTLGIVGLVVAIFFNLIGLIISAIAYSQSKKAGVKNTPALIGIIVGAALLVVGIIGGIVLFSAGMSSVGSSTSPRSTVCTTMSTHSVAG